MLQRAMLRPMSVTLAVLVAVATLVVALLDFTSTVRAGEVPAVTSMTATAMPAEDHTLILNAQTIVIIREDGADGGQSRVTIMDPDKSLVLHLNGTLTLPEDIDLSQ